MSCNSIAPRGFEPLYENSQTPVNKALTENTNPVLSTSLDILLQKHPDLEQQTVYPHCFGIGNDRSAHYTLSHWLFIFPA